MRYFRAVWNTAQKEDTSLPLSPTIAVEMYKETRRDAAIPLRQLPKWFAEVDGLKNPVIRDFLLLTVLTGLRKATVCEIRREHIDLHKGTLIIPNPKGGADRAYIIPLSDAAKATTRIRGGNQLQEKHTDWLTFVAKYRDGSFDHFAVDPFTLLSDNYIACDDARERQEEGSLKLGEIVLVYRDRRLLAS